MSWRPVAPLFAGLVLVSAAGLGGAQTKDASSAQSPLARPSAPPSATTPTLPPGMPKGYLDPTQLPDSLALLPPPPPSGSEAFARDEEVSKAMARPPGSPRWSLAASDADLKYPHSINAFACATGFTIDPKTTPTLYKLIARSMIDIGLSTYKAKNKYQRVRPFVAHGNTTCYPPDEAALRKDGSYPSGHSALGWGWALILTEVAPQHVDTILQRGRDFGQSRLVCNVHWASDVDAGRVIASATVARLHADPAFQTDLQAAKAEIARASAPAPTVCTTEQAALQESAP